MRTGTQIGRYKPAEAIPQWRSDGCRSVKNAGSIFRIFVPSRQPGSDELWLGNGTPPEGMRSFSSLKQRNREYGDENGGSVSGQGFSVAKSLQGSVNGWTPLSFGRQTEQQSLFLAFLPDVEPFYTFESNTGLIQRNLAPLHESNNFSSPNISSISAVRCPNVADQPRRRQSERTGSMFSKKDQIQCLYGTDGFSADFPGPNQSTKAPHGRRDLLDSYSFIEDVDDEWTPFFDPLDYNEVSEKAIFHSRRLLRTFHRDHPAGFHRWAEVTVVMQVLSALQHTTMDHMLTQLMGDLNEALKVACLTSGYEEAERREMLLQNPSVLNSRADALLQQPCHTPLWRRRLSALSSGMVSSFSGAQSTIDEKMKLPHLANSWRHTQQDHHTKRPRRWSWAFYRRSTSASQQLLRRCESDDTVKTSDSRKK